MHEIAPKAARVFQYSTAITPVTEDGNNYVLAKAVKAYLTADELTMDNRKRWDMAELMLERYGVDEMLPFNTLVQHSKGYLQFLEDTFHPTNIYKKYPLRYHHKGRLFEKIIDLILETDQGLVIIQNSGFAGGAKQWKNKDLALGAWLYLAEEGLKIVFKEEQARCFINYPMGGGMVEVKINRVQIEEGGVKSGKPVTGVMGHCLLLLFVTFNKSSEICFLP